MRRNLLRECALHAAFDCCDDLRTQFCGRDDLIHRADLSGPLDVVDRFEFGCHFAELVGADGDALSVQFYAQMCFLRVILGCCQVCLQLLHLRVVVGAGVHLTGEDHCGGGGAAEYRRERAFDSKNFHVVVERTGEHTTNAPPW